MSRTASELAHLFRALKAPAAARALPVLADRAREESWSYERFAEALLFTEVASRDSHGGESRIKAARFPARKTLEEFNFTFQRSVKKTVVEHLGQLDFLHARENVILLGPPAEITAVALDTGELACRHARVFAGGLCFTDPAHQAALERLRGERRARPRRRRRAAGRSRATTR